MAARSELKIDVDSAEFQAFADKFNKYAELLKNIPDTWKKIEKSTAVSKTNFETAAEAVGITAGSMAAIQKSAGEFYHVTTATARSWKDLAYSTGSVAKNIASATESLLKWTGILSLVTGAGGLFGFDRLAHSVSSQRTSALGTGGDYGKRSAFLTAFRRFGDPEGLLSRVAEAQANQGVGLRQLGLSEKEMKGDPADVAIRAERAMARLARNIPESQLGIDPHLKFFNIDEIRRAKAHPEEIEGAANSYQQNQGALGLSQKDQLAYTNFTTQMEKAGREIETIFVKGLVKLADPLGRLSDDVIKLAEKFTNKDGPLGTLVTDLGRGIEWLAGEIDKPEFQKGVDTFIGKIGDLAGGVGTLLTAIEKIAAWFGIGAGSGSLGGLSSLSDAPATSLSGQKGHGPGSQRAKFGGRPWQGGAPGNAADAMKFARDQLIKEGVSPEHADAAAAALVGNAIAESGLRPDTVHDHGTGYGIYGARNERKTGMLDWTRAHGFADNSLEGQQRYQVHEALTVPRFAETARALRGATDPVAAGRVVESNFEAPGRLNNRDAAFKSAYSKRPTVNVRNTPGGNIVNSSNAAAAGSP